MIISENKLRNLIKNKILNNILKENQSSFSAAFDNKKLIKNMLEILDACKDHITTLKFWSNESIEEQKLQLKILFKDKDIEEISAEDLFFNVDYDDDLNNIKSKYFDSPLEILLSNCLGSGIKNDKRKVLLELIAEGKIDEIVKRLIKTVSYRSKGKKNVEIFPGAGNLNVRNLSKR